MPLVEVHLARGRSPEQLHSLLEAITNAVETTIGAPRDSIRVWIQEFDPAMYMAGGVTIADRQAGAGPRS